VITTPGFRDWFRLIPLIRHPFPILLRRRRRLLLRHLLLLSLIFPLTGPFLGDPVCIPRVLI